MSSNAIGMINPNNPGAGVTQYAIPTGGSGPGPIAAGPEPILYASDIAKGQIYKIDKTTGALLQTIPVSAGLDSLVFDSHNNIIYTAYSVGGAGELGGWTRRSASRPTPSWPRSETEPMTYPGAGRQPRAAQQHATGKIYDVDLNNPGHTPTTFGGGQYKDGIVRQFRPSVAVSNPEESLSGSQTFHVIAKSGPLADVRRHWCSTRSPAACSPAHDQPGIGPEGDLRADLQPGNFLQATLITNRAFPTTFNPDGLEADGEGNLYLASQGSAMTAKSTGTTSPPGN